MTASMADRSWRSACWRRSGLVSTSSVVVAVLSSTEERKRLLRGWGEVHTSHLQPIIGTPVEVPLPRKSAFIIQFEC